MRADDRRAKSPTHEELVRSQGFLEAVFASIQDGVSILDTELTIQRVNPVMERWYAERMPLVGQRCFWGYHQAKRPCQPCPAMRALKTGETESDVVRGPAGSPVKWLELFAYPIRDPETNEITGVAEFVRDITERREASEQLAASEARFRSYVEHAPDGIFVADGAGHYVDVNPAACAMTGYCRDELLDMHLLELLPTEARETAEAHFRRVISEGMATGQVLPFVRKDGSTGYWVVTAIKLSETRLLGFAKDVSESALLAERLRHAETMQVVGQLAGGVAHDFNNQLSGILGFAELLLEETRDDPLLTEYAQSIVTGAKRSADLTAQLLAYSRTGKYLHSVVDMHQVVEEVVGLLKRSIDKRIKLELDLAASPSTTEGDPTQLQNALLNLALNARDAMANGGVLRISSDVVEVSAREAVAAGAELTPGRYLELAVSDTGAGIDEQTQQRIFEPFFTTKPRGEGTGMGLAAVYGTTKSHHGAVAVRSAPGRGSTFSLRLPLIEPGARSRSATAEEPVAEPKGMPHVLLVDDERIVRQVAERMLQRLGCRVTSCGDGTEAVAIYREQWRSVDLVILDVVMPRMDGEEAMAALREINPEATVLVSSGYSLEGKAERMLAGGAKDFIQKPFRKAQLAARISELLGR